MASRRATRADHALRMARAREVMGDLAAGAAAILLALSTAISVFALYAQRPAGRSGLSVVAVASAAGKRSGIGNVKSCPETALPRE